MGDRSPVGEHGAVKPLSAAGRRVTNEAIAGAFERIADVLEAQHASNYRVRAYREAALSARRSARPLVELLEEGGRKALIAVPAIGRTTAAQIEELAHTGRISLLERLEGELSPGELFTTVPGIGPELAMRIHDQLHIATLEALEQAAHDGRLDAVPGFGPRRLRGVRESLATILRDASWRRALPRREAADADPVAPKVEVLLDVDGVYRRRAGRDELPRITPRRFNPKRERWLPILHTERDGWEITALFSNTARAHELGMTHDWVVIFYEREGREGQCTVVTERRGPQQGERVVRGREDACAAWRKRHGKRRG